MDWICPSLVVTGVGGLGTWVGLGWGQQEKATSGSEHATHTVTHYKEETRVVTWRLRILGATGETTGGNRYATQSRCYTQEKQIRLSISNC